MEVGNFEVTFVASVLISMKKIIVEMSSQSRPVNIGSMERLVL